MFLYFHTLGPPFLAWAPLSFLKHSAPRPAAFSHFILSLPQDLMSSSTFNSLSHFSLFPLSQTKLNLRFEMRFETMERSILFSLYFSSNIQFYCSLCCYFNTRPLFFSPWKHNGTVPNFMLELEAPPFGQEGKK